MLTTTPRRLWLTTILMASGLMLVSPPAPAADIIASPATENFVWTLMTDARPGELRYCRDLPLIGLTCHKIRLVQAGSFGFLHLDIGDAPDEKRNFRRQADGSMIDIMSYAPEMQARLQPNAATGIVKRDKQQYRLTLAVETTYQSARKPGGKRELARTRTIELVVPERNLDRLRQIRDLAQRLQAGVIVKQLDYLLD